MLVLTRKLNETVIVGDDIVVTVLAINGKKVRLGFEAPRSVPIVREEIHDIPRQRCAKAHARVA
ncbi:MAG: carbon storage regulator CsrA [Planctomycetota bacterium]|nr:carbon storage regulator CsrA [Planctomycetota bacterium]